MHRPRQPYYNQTDGQFFEGGVKSLQNQCILNEERYECGTSKAIAPGS